MSRPELETRVPRSTTCNPELLGPTALFLNLLQWIYTLEQAIHANLGAIVTVDFGSDPPADPEGG